MKKNLFKLSFLLILVWFFWGAGQAKADTATTTIRLQIKTNDASLYDGNIDVTACPEADGSATSTINVRCAVDQTGLTDPSDWVYGGTFLNSIGGNYASDYTNNIYWGWFSNLEYGQVSMTQHILVDDEKIEKILLIYNTNPLRISADNATPYVNATSTVTLEQFGLDESWSPVWLPAASSTLVIAGQETGNASGNYVFTATSSGSILIYGKKTGYIDSETITITAQEQQNNDNNQNQTPAGGSVIIIPASGAGGGTATPPPAEVKVDLGKAIDFLIAKQAADGSFGSALITDWAALALASANPNGAAGQKVKIYLLTDPSPLVGLNPVSDYARRAMALMSLNISPYGGAKTDYIKKIVGLFDGRQFGDASLYNDDIFALLVLNKAGYKAEDEIIKQTAAFIISRQQVNGSWQGVDLTAAAVQALAPLAVLPDVSAALGKAKNFLVGVQQADGGFGNSYATAWVMQAVIAMGENPADWQRNNQTPESYLAQSQGADGGLEKEDAYETNRVWSTAYAIPAVLGKPWTSLLNNFPLGLVAPEAIRVNDLSSNDLVAATTTATTTIIATTTMAVASTTLEIIALATTTAEIIARATSTEPLPVKSVESVKSKTASQSASQVAAKAKAPVVVVAKPKAKTPRVLGEKLQATAAESKPITPAAGANLDIKAAAPTASHPVTKLNFFALASQWLYNGLKYFLNLLGL